MTANVSDRIRRRLELVEEHVRRENDHDLEGVLATFGKNPVYEEQAWGERHDGAEGVQGYYTGLLDAMPDLSIDVIRRHAAEEAVILEVVIRGTHRGSWRGLPATGRRLEFPLCAVYTFTDDDRLAGERIYYDRATVFAQLGLFREPMTTAGRITTALAHPLTLARAYGRRLVGR